MEHFEFAG
jgi:hypothetical protein